MLRSGTIRRVRQTLMATNLAAGALCAWQVPPERLDEAFAWLFREDPFSGHVVIRTTDSVTAGSNYRLWTTLKVPQGFSLEKHAAFLARTIGAQSYRLMPAKALFALGVGHVRRRGIEPGARATELAEVKDTDHRRARRAGMARAHARSSASWPTDEIVRDVWAARAREAGVSLARVRAHRQGSSTRKASSGASRRFSSTSSRRQHAGGQSVTRYNALFHWKVPLGRETDAGREVGRHYIMTHAYWREGGPEFKGVNVMGVAHGMEKDAVLAHKAAIDAHLREAGIDFDYTNVFWGGRSEIKPSEIAPGRVPRVLPHHNLDPEAMR